MGGLFRLPHAGGSYIKIIWQYKNITETTRFAPKAKKIKLAKV
jgi:hypothetical protein